MKNKKYLLPLTLVFSLFFLWAISSNLLPTMIRQLMKSCDLNPFQASFTESAYWLAYFICPIPIAMFLKRFSYKAGIIFGLSLAAVGAFLFFPASTINVYGVYLTIFFLIATGMCFLETAANPYVTALGDAETAPRRLNLAQAFNGLGAFIAAMFLSKAVLASGNFSLVYFILGGILVLAAVIFIFSHLPKTADEVMQMEENEKDGKLIDFSVLKHHHLRWGVIAQFFYNGGQTAINSLFLVYCCTYAGIDEETATTYFGIYMLCFLLGRWIGTWLMGQFKPQNMLLTYAIINVVLCIVVSTLGGEAGIWAMMAISFFMSIMYPTQFSMALTGLGKQTKSGSAFLVMAIVGNACLPQFTAYVMNSNPDIYQIAYIIPAICFSFCAYYGWKGHIVD
ncbi:MAG: sugar MFS transporter [Bacteroidales bacterium]|nr:sugar MFS transporter [Bacteroidales bacterium]